MMDDMKDVLIKKAILRKRKPETWTNWFLGIDREWDVREVSLIEVNDNAFLSWRVEGEEKERNRVNIFDAQVSWDDSFGSLPCVLIETKAERDLYLMAKEHGVDRDSIDQEIKDMREWYYELAMRSSSKADVKKQMTKILTMTEKDLKNPFSELSKEKAEERGSRKRGGEDCPREEADREGKDAVGEGESCNGPGGGRGGREGREGRESREGREGRESRGDRGDRRLRGQRR